MIAQDLIFHRLIVRPHIFVFSLFIFCSCNRTSVLTVGEKFDLLPSYLDDKTYSACDMPIKILILDG